MNKISHQITLLIICLIACAEAAAQKPAAPKASASQPAQSSMVGLMEAIRQGMKEVSPNLVGGGGSGHGKMFVFPEGRFKVVLRAKPEKKETEGVSQNQKVKVVTFDSVPDRVIKYQINYLDLPASVAGFDVKKIYDDGRDWVLGQNQFKLTSENDFSLAGQPGRELTFDNGKVRLKSRLLLVGRRFYELRIFGPSNKSYDFYFGLEAKTFLESFKFVPAGREDELTKGAAAAFENADYTGDARDRNYASEYFGLKLELPEGWKLTTYGQAGDSLAYRHINVDLLFIAGKEDTPKGYVAQTFLVLGIEQLRDEKMAAADYLKANQQALAEAGLKFKLAREPHREDFGGISFSVMEAETEQSGQAVKNRFYATVRNGVALFFVLQSSAPQDLKAMVEVIHHINFDKAHTSNYVSNLSEAAPCLQLST